MNAPVHDERFEADLIDALDALERGEAAESILARHPATAAALRPALEAAARLSNAIASPTAQQANASRAALLAAFDARFGAATPAATPSSPPPAPALVALPGGSAARRPTWRTPRLAWLATAASVAALVAATPVAYAASHALPGDALYAVKEVGRDAWLAASFSPATHRARASAVAAARRDDVAVAMAAGRSGVVTFEGVIEAYASEWCRISGLTVQVPRDVAEYGESEHPGAFGVGDHVRIQGRLSNGQLVATAMLPFLDYGQPAPPAHPVGEGGLAPPASTTAPSPTAPPTPPTAPATAPADAAAAEPPPAAPGGPGGPAAPPGGAAPAPPSAGAAAGRGGDEDADRDEDRDDEGDDDEGDDKGGDRAGGDGGDDDDDDDKGGDRGGGDDDDGDTGGGRDRGDR